MKPRLLFAVALPLIITSSSLPAATLYWKSTTATNAWTGSFWGASAGGPYTTAYATGSSVVFEDNGGVGLALTGATTNFASIIANENVTVTAGGTLGTGGTVASITVASGKNLNFGTQTFSAAIGTGLIKNGDGILTLAGGTYAGGFTLNAGTVAVAGVNAMGAGGLLTINGGIIRSNGTSARDLTGKYAGGITIGGNFTLGDVTNNGTLTFTNNMAMGAATRTITANSTAILGGVISGGSGVGLIKAGVGNLTLAGANTFSGNTEVTAGTLAVRNAGALSTGSVTLNGGVLQFDTTAGMTVSNAINASVASQINANNIAVTLSGPITISGSTTFRGQGGAANQFTLSNANAITSANNSSVIFTLDSSQVHAVNGVINIGSGSLTKNSTATLSLNAANPYTGATTITGGVLSLGGATGSILNSSSITANGGTLNFDNTAGNANRVTNSQFINLVTGGGLSLTGNATSNSTETVGGVNVTASGVLTVTSATDRVTTLDLGAINRTTSKATVLVRGTSLDQTAATNVARITVGGGPLAMVGTNALAGAPTNDATPGVKIIPWMLGDTAVAGTGSAFVTQDSVLGLRVLSAAQTAPLTTAYTTAATPENVTVSGPLTLDNTAGIEVNSLLFNTAAADLNSTAAQPLTIHSGAIAATFNAATSIGSGFSSVVLGNGDGYVTVAASTLTLNAPVNVTSGGGLTKSGGGTLALAAANTYSGKTTLNAGTLTFSTIGNVGGGASNLGAPTTVADGTIDWVAGTLTYTGTGSSSDRGINLQLPSTGTVVSLFNNGTGMLTLGGAVTGTGTLALRGDTGNITLSGVIAHDGALNRTDTGTVFLTNPNNSFTGAINANKGVVSFDSIADSGVNSPIGAGNSIVLGQNGFNNTGTIQFTGASGGSSNRPITIFGNGASTNGGIIENTVVGQTLTLSGAVTTGSGTAPSLVLTGAGDGVMSGNVSGSGLTVTKSGAGTWALTGTNTYTGATTVQDGLLKFNGTPQAFSAITLGGGIAGSTATLGTAADALTVNGGVTYSATNHPNGAAIVAALNLGGAVRTFTVGDSTNAAKDLTVSGVISNGGLTKAGTGTLALTAANTFNGAVQITGIATANTLRIEHAEALGPVATAKTITLTGSNRQVAILELANNITVDVDKTIGTSGKSYMASGETGFGSPVFLRNASGNNTWLGNVLITSGGGGYSIESASGTLTLGTPGTTSVIRNDVSPGITRVIDVRGAGDVVVHSQIINNLGITGALSGINKLGTGTLTLPRTDNTATGGGNFAVGTTVVANMTAAGTPSAIGAGATFNLGGTFRHVGAVDSSSNRAFGLIGNAPKIESSGVGTLSLTSGTAVAHIVGAGTTVAAFGAGATVLTGLDVWSLFPGMTLDGTGITPGTKISGVNYDTREITIDTPTATANAVHNVVTIGGTGDLNRTLTLGGSNTGNNLLASPLANPAGTGKLGVTKADSGKWLLSGTNTYSGITTVAGGTLLVNGSHTGGDAYTVAPGAILGGTGSTASAITIHGTLAPGSSIESFGVGALSFGVSSTFAYELDSNVLNGDLTYSSGALDIADGSLLTLAELAGGPLLDGSKLTLISYNGTRNAGQFTYLGSPLADDSTFTLGSNKWLFNYNDEVKGSNFTADQASGVRFVTMTVVPEPAAAMLGLLGTTLLLRRRRNAGA